MCFVEKSFVWHKKKKREKDWGKKKKKRETGSYGNREQQQQQQQQKSLHPHTHGRSPHMHASMCYTNNNPSIITNSCTHVRNNLPKDFRSVLRNRKPVHTSAAGTLHTCHNIFSLSLFPSPPSSSSSGRTHNLCLCQWYYFFIPTKFDYQKRVVFISFFWKKERKKEKNRK